MNYGTMIALIVITVAVLMAAVVIALIMDDVESEDKE